MPFVIENSQALTPDSAFKINPRNIQGARYNTSLFSGKNPCSGRSGASQKLIITRQSDTMASYHGPKAKVQRRFGEVLMPRPKYQKILSNRSHPPGEHGKEKAFRSGRRSDYGLQLDEKQKLSFIYNVRERQLRNYYKRATQMPGRTGGNLLMLLETRLDNVVYRAGYAPTIWAARQLVRHGHIKVNGSRLDLPSYSVRPDDVVSIGEKMRKNVHMEEWVEQVGAVPSFLELDRNAFSVRLARLPEAKEIPVQVNVQLVVEYYNRLT